MMVMRGIWWVVHWLIDLTRFRGPQILFECWVSEHVEPCLLNNNKTGVGECPFLRILNITFNYLLEIITPIVGWCEPLGHLPTPVRCQKVGNLELCIKCHLVLSIFLGRRKRGLSTNNGTAEIITIRYEKPFYPTTDRDGFWNRNRKWSNGRHLEMNFGKGGVLSGQDDGMLIPTKK